MCGIAGMFWVPGAERYVADLLFAIQHRGQESCGISVRRDDDTIATQKQMGLVKHVFTPETLDRFTGSSAIGHVRYPTAGSSDILNSQPHAIPLPDGSTLALCANGDIVNYAEWRTRLEQTGVVFTSNNDGELIARLIAHRHAVEGLTIEEAITRAQSDLKGAFSALLIHRDRMYAFRDPHGFRPYVMGHLTWQGTGEMPAEGTCFASESCAFGIIGARFIRELKPGEILKLERNRPVTTVAVNGLRPRHCVFELIYFSRPDTLTFGEFVHDVRKKIGATLARGDRDIPPGDDLVVMAVPDSSNFVALGYAAEKKAPFDMGLIRNHYVGRTFIRPHQEKRDEGVKQKFNPLPGFFPGKRVILVDDSIVRGTTLRKIVRMIKRNGAKEVHVRIGSPRVTGSCFYGIDTPTRTELIANNKSIAETAEYLTADSLRHIALPDLLSLLARPDDFCNACFSGDYIYVPDSFVKTNAPGC